MVLRFKMVLRFDYGAARASSVKRSYPSALGRFAETSVERNLRCLCGCEELYRISRSAFRAAMSMGFKGFPQVFSGFIGFSGIRGHNDASFRGFARPGVRFEARATVGIPA